MSREDDDEERMRREEEDSIAIAANNSWKYVGARYIDLNAKDGIPVSVSPTVQLASSGAFYPVTHGDEVNIQPGPEGKGIHVQLKDGSTGEIGDYRMETNGKNGVQYHHLFRASPPLALYVLCGRDSASLSVRHREFITQVGIAPAFQHGTASSSLSAFQLGTATGYGTTFRPSYWALFALDAAEVTVFVQKITLPV